jgi:hypothetical protein
MPTLQPTNSPGSICGGCKDCSTQCEYCDSRENFDQCINTCQSICLANGKLICTLKELSLCRFEDERNSCEGMCAICNLRETNRSTVKECYEEWIDTCGSHCSKIICKYTTTSISSKSSLDNCDRRCKALCYNSTYNYDCNVRKLSVFKQCYTNCHYTCIPRVVKLSILLSILVLLLLFTIGVIIHKGIYSRKPRQVSYDLLYEYE